MNLSALTVSAEEGTGFLWDLHTGNITAHYTGCAAQAQALTPAGRHFFFAALSDQPKAMGWSWGQEQPAMRSVVPEKMSSICATLDGAFVLAGALSGSLYAWDVASGQLLAAFPAHYGEVSCISITDDDSLVVTGGSDAIVHTWQLSDVLCAGTNAPTNRHSWTDHSLPVTEVLCGVGGMAGHIVSVSRDNTCKVWQAIHEPHSILSITLPTPLLCGALDPSERAIVTAGEDGAIYCVSLVQTSDSEQYTKMVGHTAAVLSLSITYDGSLVLSSSVDCTARVWDLASRQPIVSFTMHKSAVTCALVVNSLQLLPTNQKLKPLHRRLDQVCCHVMTLLTALKEDEVGTQLHGVQLSCAGQEPVPEMAVGMDSDGGAMHQLRTELANERKRAAHWESVAEDLQKKTAKLVSQSLAH